eukprot:gnl/TRDRNA2_/TRDRNA2_173815_c2_seq12.p1 gnl/TRDRNA2_/TRDRNA2_173815_c2~~gnl/TRDRNA2_/TRDRNA2_173815_c2_seq12.p1  ORF type:complete len:281 (-),score=35.43 gnl/TRDRNA2_/TRDRNA2_173815_c2_seq12:247-1089(-)
MTMLRWDPQPRDFNEDSSASLSEDSVSVTSSRDPDSARRLTRVARKLQEVPMPIGKNLSDSLCFEVTLIKLDIFDGFGFESQVRPVREVLRGGLSPAPGLYLLESPSSGLLRRWNETHYESERVKKNAIILELNGERDPQKMMKMLYCADSLHMKVAPHSLVEPELQLAERRQVEQHALAEQAYKQIIKDQEEAAAAQKKAAPIETWWKGLFGTTEQKSENMSSGMDKQVTLRDVMQTERMQAHLHQRVGPSRNNAIAPPRKPEQDDKNSLFCCGRLTPR